MSIRGYIKWLWLAAEGLRGRIFLQAAVGVVHVAVSLMYVWTSKQLIDIATSRIEGNIYLFIAAMVGCIITQILLSTYVSRMEVESELDMKNRLRHRLFSHMMDSRWASGGQMHTGDVMNRIWEDVDNIANTVCVVVPQTAVTCVQFVAAVTFLAILDYRLAMAVVLILPTFLLLSRMYARRIRSYTKEIRDIDSRVQAHIQENMHHRTLVSSMEYTPCVVEDLQTMQADLREKVMRRTDFTLFSRKMMQLGFSAGYLSAFVWGAFRLQAGAGYGLMTAFMQLAGQVQRPIMELSRQLPSFIHVTTAVDRLIELTDLPLEERGAIHLAGEVGILILVVGIVDLADVLAQHAHAQQLDAAQKQGDAHLAGPAGHGIIGEVAHKAPNNHTHTDQKHAQTQTRNQFQRAGGQAGDAVRRQMQHLAEGIATPARGAGGAVIGNGSGAKAHQRHQTAQVQIHLVELRQRL